MVRQSSNLQPKILRNARAMLLAEGYRGLSMRKLANGVGCTATSIYLYFKNKDELIHSLIDEGIGHLYDRLRTAAQQAKGAQERVDGLCRAYLDFGLENPEYYEIMFQLHPTHMTRYPAEKYRRARQNLQLFTEALATRANRSDGPTTEDHLRANTIWSNLHGAVSLLLAGRVDVRLDKEAYLEAVIKDSAGGVA
jgi:AcrR family transcriptional regulator